MNVKRDRLAALTTRAVANGEQPSIAGWQALANDAIGLAYELAAGVRLAPPPEGAPPPDALRAAIQSKLERHGIPLAVWEPSGKAHGLRPDEAEWLAADIMDLVRAALEAATPAEPPAPPPLDVDRLALALHVMVDPAWGGKGAPHTHLWCQDQAGEIAAEYARLGSEALA